MRPFLHNTFALVALALLLGLSVVQTCQLDRLERRVIALESGGGPRPSASTSAGLTGPRTTEAELRADLADPTNLLRPMGRPLVKAATVARGGTLRLELPSDPRGMSPYLSTGADVVELDRYMNNRLALRIPGDLDHYAPELATHVSTPDDGLTYVVRLRKGVRWHTPAVDVTRDTYAWLREPHELTADDFVFVLDMMQNPAVLGRVSSYRTYFEKLTSYRAVDRYTLELKFSERLATNFSSIVDLSPSPRWLFMHHEDGKPLDAATWGTAINTHWYLARGVGTGPYRFVSWIPGVAIELVRNPDYWGEAPAFDRVVFRVVKDPASWPRLLKTGELDMIRLQPEQYRSVVVGAKGPLLDEPRVKTARATELGYLFVGWNAARPYFADPRVRRAMTLALDRQAIVAQVFNGLGRVTSGPYPQESPCYDHGIAPWPYDPAAAARLLDEAGWVDGDGDGLRDKLVDGRRVPFSFELMIYGSIPEWATFASVYQQSLAKLGIKLVPVAIEWAAMLKRLDDRAFDAHVGSWVMGWDIDLAQIWHSAEADRPGSSNRVSFRDAASDQVIEALRREQDPAKRAALCHTFHARVHELQPYTFLYQRDRAYLYWDYLNTPELSLLNPNRDVRFLSFREARP